MAATLTAMARDQQGATGIEYAFLLALTTLAIVAGAELLGTQLNAFFQAAAGELKTAAP